MKTRKYLMLALLVGALLVPATAEAGKVISKPTGYTSYCDLVDCNDPLIQKYPELSKLGVKLDLKIKLLNGYLTTLPPGDPKIAQVQREIDALTVQYNRLVEKIMQLPEVQDAMNQEQ